MERQTTCLYHDESGCVCEEPALESGLCFWHDPDVDKNQDDLIPKLEHYAQSGGLLRGVVLKRTNLAGIDLVKYNSKQGYDFTGADFYRCNLQGAHMFNIQLRKGSLMKADLRNANLNHAKLEDTNLLGAKLEHCKVESLDIGKQLMQERLGKAARERGDVESMKDYFQQGEEIYRSLRKTAESEGLFSAAGCFLKRELTLRRYQMPERCFRRALSKLVDLVCGYGEEPLRVVLTSCFIIISCAIIYFFTGLHFNGEVVVFSSEHSLTKNALSLAECLYYSVVTFTTLGYGDFTPIGYSRFFAALEAFSGSFIIALFVVVFVKKMTR